MENVKKFRKYLEYLYIKLIKKCYLNINKYCINCDNIKTKKLLNFYNQEIKLLKILKIIANGYELLSNTEKNKLIKNYEFLIFKHIEDAIILSEFFNEYIYLQKIDQLQKEYLSNKNFDKIDLNFYFKICYDELKDEIPDFLI